MKKALVFSVFFVLFFIFNNASVAWAQTRRLASPSPSPSPEATATPEPSPTPTPTPRPDLTQTTEEAVGPLEKLLNEQYLGPALPFNPLKYAIRSAVAAGVPANTIVLLLLLPLIALVIATARHFIGLRGFGIFLPAALAVVFVATGPIVGITIFLAIVIFSTIFRMILRVARIKLQYLPRMAFILWFVVLGVLGVLFLAPVIQIPGLTNVSIFPVLVLVLLAEDFTKVQLGKSARTAISFAIESIILSLVSYIFLTTQSLQRFALLNPEVTIFSVAVFDFLLGKYTGLRIMEYWRFRKLILKS
jgi:hypothetical protein